MTRERQNKISGEATDYMRFKCNTPSLDELIIRAFEDGAKWADAHPHWISVEDEFPIDYEPVLAVVGGNHFAFVGICLNKKTWYCEIQNKATEIIGITHWCHLPQPPVLSNSENTGKNHLIDANNMVEHLRETTKMIEKGGEE